MKQQIVFTLFALLLLSPALTSAQDDAQKTARLPYEVVVTPTVTRTGLRSLIANVEDDFVERFNELNLDDDYDVLCSKQTLTMSHRRRRICEPAFLIQARAEIQGTLIT